MKVIAQACPEEARSMDVAGVFHSSPALSIAPPQAKARGKEPNVPPPYAA